MHILAGVSDLPESGRKLSPKLQQIVRWRNLDKILTVTRCCQTLRGSINILEANNKQTSCL